MCADIDGINTVFAKLLKLCFGESVTACTGNAEYIDIVVQHSCVRLPIFFENVGRIKITADILKHRNSLLVYYLCSCIIGLKSIPFFTDDFKRFLYRFILTNNAKVAEEATNLLLELRRKLAVFCYAGVFTEFLIASLGFVDLSLLICNFRFYGAFCFCVSGSFSIDSITDIRDDSCELDFEVLDLVGNQYHKRFICYNGRRNNLIKLSIRYIYATCILEFFDLFIERNELSLCFFILCVVFISFFGSFIRIGITKRSKLCLQRLSFCFEGNKSIITADTCNFGLNDRDIRCYNSANIFGCSIRKATEFRKKLLYLCTVSFNKYSFCAFADKAITLDILDRSRECFNFFGDCSKLLAQFLNFRVI